MAARLRLVETAEPRVAIASAPALAGLSAAERISASADRGGWLRVGVAVVASVALHAALIAGWPRSQSDDEARSAGGTKTEMPIEGVSVVMIDNPASAASEGSEITPQAIAMADDSAPLAMPDAASTVPAGEVAPDLADRVAAHVPDRGVAVFRDTDTAAVTEETGSPSADRVTGVPDDVPAASNVSGDAPPAAPVAKVEADTASSAGPAETGQRVATVMDATSAMPVPDAAREVSTDTPSMTGAPVALKPVADDTAQVSATGVAAEARDLTVTATTTDAAAVAAEDARVAAVDASESSSAPPPQTKTAAKPAAKPAPAPKPPAPRSVAQAPAVAEDTGKGPREGDAGSGGTSSDERGTASLSSYQAKLAAHLRRFRQFPAAAEKAGISGTAVVSFTVSASGIASGARIARSSGHPVLDQAAVAMVARASPFPPMPADLERRTLTISAPVRFDLR